MSIAHTGPSSGESSCELSSIARMRKACKDGDVDTIKSLVAHGLDVNTTNGSTETFLHLACGHGNDDAVKLLVQLKADVNVKGSMHTPLAVACLQKHVAVVRTLISHGADANIRSQDTLTPLARACLLGDIDIVRALLRLDSDGSEDEGDCINYVEPDLNVRDKENMTPLHYACQVGYLDIVKLLLSKNADIRARRFMDETPLSDACRTGSSSVADYLLQVDRHLAVDDPSIPLHYAVRRNNCQITNALLDSGLDVDTRDEKGDTALHLACGMGHRKIARLLVKLGAQVNARNRSGGTALHAALSQSGSLEVVRCLVENGADVNAENDEHDTALSISTLKGDDRMVKFLLSQGARADTGNNPLFNAIKVKHCEMVKLLVEHGADVNEKAAADSSTPLSLACEAASPEVVQILLNNGVHVDVTDAKVVTCLQNITGLKLDKLLEQFPQHEVDAKSKKDGRHEEVHFDKITSRIEKLCYGLHKEFVQPPAITLKVINGLYPGVTTVELDNLAAETAATMTTKHPDYAVLAARIAVSNLHKETKKVFSDVMTDLYNWINPKTGDHSPMISKKTYDIIMKHEARLNSSIVYDRDYSYNYFGFKTLERSYLLKIDGKVAERPQHMLMRVAVGIHGEDLPAVIETYNLMSGKWFTHASPTLFNAGTCRPQLSSCFLLTMHSDSIEGIYDTLKQCALVSKSAGGIGLNVHCIRATGSYIAGTNGVSNGLIPMLRVYNNTARYVDQGGNKRPGAFAIYLEPWHADIFDFLDLKKNTGKEETRARDLFYALWIPDLFMKRVEENGDWTLMCPNECPGLHEVWGEEFEELYTKYEKAGKGRKTIKAQTLWYSIIESQTETGTPYMLYKDACNRKSNQQNLGTIKCSNLCTEIVEYSSKDEVAVCNLASIALNMYVDEKKRKFDFVKFREVVKVMVRNLNKIIDINYYPVEEAERSNMRHRPIGLGVQGLADAFILMRYPFDSEEAQQLNKEIFEHLYFAALEASCELAEKYGPYETYAGSPVSKGILQFDMWGVTPYTDLDWATLRDNIARFGVRNSLLVAPMPTASTAQILGNNESIEAYTSNIYTRRVLSGEFQVVNHHLLKDLTDLGLWNDNMKTLLIAEGGSIQNIKGIPDDLKALYKTTWEVSQRMIIKMAADRGAFIDQSQSLNVHIAQPNYGKLSSMHFFAWKSGLKTGMYYLRTKAAASAIQFTIDKQKLAQATQETEKLTIQTGPEQKPAGDREKQGKVEEDRQKEQEEIDNQNMAVLMCSLKNKEECMMCGS